MVSAFLELALLESAFLEFAFLEREFPKQCNHGSRILESCGAARGVS